MKFTNTFLTTALCAVTLAAPAPAPYENTPVESHLEADSWIYWRNNARKGGDVYLHAYKRLTEDRLYNKQPWSHTSVILDDPTINFRVRIFGDHSWYQWVSLNTNQGSCINGFEIGGKCNEDYSYGLGPQEAITNRQADQWYPIETQGGWLIGKTVWNEGSKTTTAAKCLAQDVDGELITVQLQDIPEAMETLNKSGDWSKAGCNVYTRIKGTAKK